MTRRAPIAEVVGLALLLGLASAPVTASAEASGRDGLRLLLLAHHDAPSLEALAACTQDPTGTLVEVASDLSEPALVRRRAATVLGTIGGPRAEAALASLVATSDEGAVRRAAGRALARAMADRPDALLLALEPLLRSPAPDDREVGVLIVAGIRTEAARARLARMRVVERSRAVVDALRRAARGELGTMPSP